MGPSPSNQTKKDGNPFKLLHTHVYNSMQSITRGMNPIQDMNQSVWKKHSYFSVGHRNAFIDINSLKEVSFKSVDVSQEAVQFFLLKCPNLERLAVVGSGQLTNVVVSSTSAMLKYLEIRFCNVLQSITICDSNLISLTLGPVKKVTVTRAPMLTEVSIHWYFLSLPSYVFSELSCCLSQLEVLMLSSSEPEKFARVDTVSKLSKLKELIIYVGAWDGRSLLGVTPFLSNSCPNLQKFVLKLNWFSPSTRKRRPLRHLKVIEIFGYE